MDGNVNSLEPQELPSRPTRPAISTGQQNVFTRLQALFPPSPSTPSSAKVQSEDPASLTNARASDSKFLKVRIVTWNMNDSMPKGDLEELLGAISPRPPSKLSTENLVLPTLSNDTNHPYHIVVIAGQECPSLSGIPMGLGAGFKFKDKEKDRERDKEKDKDTDKTGDRDRDYDASRSKRTEDKDSDDPFNEGHVGPPAGWTSVIEDWLCSGHRTALNGSPAVTSNKNLLRPSARPSPMHLSTSDVHQLVAMKDQRKGPYQLLIKERMMGIYLAVYINRDVRGLVKGTSRSAVAAGLIGGRLGNKGGVGISINLDGTTLLFLNAHLAAHEGEGFMKHRLANLAKIKAELTVDDFLTHDDPRVMAEDLTDKFDYTFLCGDLNFRLDISRLHADWLMSRQEYSQALAFDQLRKVMESGEAFVGFHEAPINFPPTFKYDVLRTLKGRKKQSFKAHWKRSPERVKQLSEVEERERQEFSEEDVEEDGDVASLSSAWTSVYSKPNTDAEEEDYFNKPQDSSDFISTPQRLAIGLAALKAKSKWLGLLSPSVPSTPKRPIQRKRGSGHGRIGTSASTTDIPGGSGTGDICPSQGRKTTSLRIPPLQPGTPTKSKSSLTQSDEDVGNEKGVYDSSHKKRVPSWCDRILWKTTVEPDHEDENELELNLFRPRTRVGQFFANAFRPLSRARGSSFGSMDSSERPEASPKSDISTPSSASAPQTSDSASPFPQPANTTSNESSPTAADNCKPRVPRANSRDRFRRSPSGFSHSNPSPSSPLITINDSPADDTPPPVPPNDQVNPLPFASRWKIFQIPFRSRDAPAARNTESDQPRPSPPRKGDVVCLSYDTLDDRGMRLLEGRSDHRPVIGSYNIYI